MKKIAALLFSLLLLPACALEPLQSIDNTSNGWNSGGLADSPARVYKDPHGIVHLQGLVFKFTGPAYDQIAFTLPPGYRPLVNEWFTVASYQTVGPGSAFVPAMVTIRPDGTATITVPFDYFTWVSLSGITFRSTP